MLTAAHQVSPKWTHFTQGRLLWGSLLTSQGAAGHKDQCFSLCFDQFLSRIAPESSNLVHGPSERNLTGRQRFTKRR